MSSLGELYFSLGLDSEKFDEALKQAKQRVAELGADVNIGFNINEESLAKQVQSNLNKLQGKSLDIKVNADDSKIKELSESLAEARKELNEKLNAKVVDQSGIDRVKEKVAHFEAKLAEAKKSAGELSNAMQGVSQASSSAQHIVDENTINEVKALSEAMKALNEQMEVANRLREGQIAYNREQKEEKNRLKAEKDALKEKADEMERFSKAWMDVAKVQRDQSNEREAKILEERMKFSQEWMSAERSRIAESRKAEDESLMQQKANAKASKKELKEQLASLFQIEDAIRKLQTMKVKLNTSGIDQESDGYKRAAQAIDSYIDKLEKLQGSGSKLPKKTVSLDLKQGMREVTLEVNNAVSAQRKLESESKKASKSQGEMASKAKQFAKAFKDSSNWASQLNNQLANAFSIYSIERFIRNLYTIGGEFQKQQIALQGMIGDAEKADIIFERIKDLSVKSPFTFSELASYTKQMSAYGVEYDELYDTTKRLADISAGVGVDMGRLILAYGQVRSAEVLRGQELRQFTEAGIPIVAELAKRLEEVRGKSVAIGEVFDAISKREISFGMVKDVLFDMTDPGGRFFGMQERLAQSLSGQWSNLKDAWEIMIADIANGTNGTLSKAVQLATEMMREWRDWIPAIASIVSAIGSLNAIIKIATTVQAAYNAIASANPYVAIAKVVLAAAAALGTYSLISNITTDNTASSTEEIKKNIQAIKENDENAKRYLDTIKNQNTSEEIRIALYKELIRLYPDLFDEMGMEKTILEDIATLKDRISNSSMAKSLDEYNVKIRLNDEEIQSIKDSYKSNTSSGGVKYRAMSEEDKKRVKDLELHNEILKSEREKFVQEANFSKAVQALKPEDTVEKYIELYGEIGRAIKVLREGGITGQIVNPAESEREIEEYYNKLKSALQEEEGKLTKFKSNTDIYKNAEATAKIYRKAIESIGGIWNTKTKKETKEKTGDDGKEAAKSFADGVKEELDKISKSWDLYKQLFELTGNKNFAITAFKVTPVWDEAAKEMLEKFKNLAKTKGIDWDIDFNISDADAKIVYGDFYDSWKEIKDRIEKNGIDLKVNAAKAYHDAMTLDEQLKALEAQRDEELSQYHEEDPMYASILEKWESEIRKVRGELFALSPEFKDLLVDTTAMGVSELTRLYNKAVALKAYIDQNRTKTVYENGKPVGYEYTQEDGRTGYISIDEYEKINDVMNKTKKKASEVKIAFNEMWAWITGEDADKDGKADKKFIDIADSLGVLSKEIAGTISSFSDMFDSLGNESLADSLSFTADMVGSVGDIADGISSGNPLAILNGITGAISNIAQYHDKKLDKAIDKSKLKVKELSNYYKNIESAISTQLGGATSSQTKAMMDSLEKQRSELYSQMEMEEDKKKTDDSKVSDYKQQIHEVEREIQMFYKNLASEQYGINIKDWSSQIAKALTDAFAKGEDAATAFKRTTSDILRNLVTEMINLNIIQKAFKDVEDYLFGVNGIATEKSEGGTDITAREAAGLANKMKGLEDSFGDAKKIWDSVNEATGGMLDSVEDASGSLTSDIKGVSEDTAQLLASYLNSTRQDVSVNRTLLEQLIGVDVPKMNYLAEAQLRELSQIQVNTAKNASLVGEIRDLMNRVVDKGSNKLKI